MAVVTKVKITSDSKMEAGEFIEAEVTGVKVNSASEVRASELVEGNAPAQFTAEGGIRAVEFKEV